MTTIPKAQYFLLTPKSVNLAAHETATNRSLGFYVIDARASG